MLPIKQITFKPIDTCLNCGMQFDEDDQNCRACGAKKIEERFTPKKVLNEAGERIFNIDNTFLRTFKDLFLRPQAVIGGFLAGLRKRYLNAFSYFTIAITISGFQVFVMKRFYPEVVSQMGVVDGKGNPISQILQDSIMEYQPVVMFATIPLLAFMGWLTFLTLKKHNYTEHFIIQLYSYSHLSILSALIGILSLVVRLNYVLFSLLSIPIYILYNMYVFKRLYLLSYKGIVLRSLFFLSILFVLYILLSVMAFAVIAMFNPEIFKELASQNAG